VRFGREGWRLISTTTGLVLAFLPLRKSSALVFGEACGGACGEACKPQLVIPGAES
jgi:hypothetical protein